MSCEYFEATKEVLKDSRSHFGGLICRGFIALK